VVSDERDLACANARTLLTHVMDGRTDQHCSVTHCDDSCHVISPLVINEMTRFGEKNEQDLRSGSPTCPSAADTLVLPMRNVQTWQTVSTRLDLLNFLIDMQIAKSAFFLLRSHLGNVKLVDLRREC
jgi:hypothetical protein